MRFFLLLSLTALLAGSLSAPAPAAEKLVSFDTGSHSLPLGLQLGPQMALATTDPHLNSSSWELARPGFPTLWDTTTGSPETIVAVIDTGVGPHPDLGSLVAGYDFVNDDEDPQDDAGHGTAVAGIVNAIPNNGIGISGVCWTCQVMPLKVLDAKGKGNWEDVAAAIRWAADHGADVINLSLSASAAPPVVAEAVVYAQTRNILVIAAAGNQDQPLAHAPAIYPGVLSVGAVNDHDIRYTKTLTNGVWGSNHGSSVAVAAAGCTVTTWVGGAFANFCGTSAATPFVSGLAGLLRSYAPSATADAISLAIRTSAVAQPDFAHGRIDAVGALRTLGTGTAPAPVVPPVAPQPAAVKLAAQLKASRTRVARGQLVTLTLTTTTERDSGRTFGTIALPRQLQFVSVHGPSCQGRRMISCELGNLSAGKAYRMRVVARMLGKGRVQVRGYSRVVDGVTSQTNRSLYLYGG